MLDRRTSLTTTDRLIIRSLRVTHLRIIGWSFMVSAHVSMVPWWLSAAAGVGFLIWADRDESRMIRAAKEAFDDMRGEEP